MNAGHEKRISPPLLNRIPAADLKRMQRDGLAGLCELDDAQMKRIWGLIRRMWYTFYSLIVRDGQPIITGFFIFNADESRGDFSQLGAVCSTWDGCSCIGLDYTAGNASDDDITLLLLHELTHAVLLQDEHDEEYESFLNHLIGVYNREFETQIINDYEGFTGSERDKMRLIQNQRRADSRAIPTAWIEKPYRADGKTATPRKKKKAAADDSSQSTRQAMIWRMQKQDKQAASEKSQVRKDYNGAHIGIE